MVVAADGFPGWRIFGLILLCMVFARTAAMTFNRIADWEIDKRNPRTEGRHKLLGRGTAITTCAGSSVLFIVMPPSFFSVSLSPRPLRAHGWQ